MPECDAVLVPRLPLHRGERVARAVGARQRRSTAGRLWSAERVQTAIVLACRCCDSYGHDSSQSRRRRFKPEYGPLALIRDAFCLHSALRAPCTHGYCGHPKRHNVTEGSALVATNGGQMQTQVAGQACTPATTLRALRLFADSTSCKMAWGLVWSFD